MRIARRYAALALACVCVNAAAQGAAAPLPSAASAAAMPLVQGEVRKLDLNQGLVVLRHGDIPNLAMPPMTMGFDVADRKMLQGLKVGDKVRFQAEMIKGKATVTELRRAAER
jgi:Cu(I)/Ag(I) efflux system membrane protein CusA/SilA